MRAVARRDGWRLLGSRAGLAREGGGWRAGPWVLGRGRLRRVGVAKGGRRVRSGAVLPVFADLDNLAPHRATHLFVPLHQLLADADVLLDDRLLLDHQTLLDHRDEHLVGTAGGQAVVLVRRDVLADRLFV